MTLVDQRSFGLPLFMNPEDDERGGFGPRHRRVHFLQRHYDDDMALGYIILDDTGTIDVTRESSNYASGCKKKI